MTATKLIELIKERQEIVREVDGFYYYMPNKCGFLAAHQLRWIADELDRMNEPWQKQIEKDLS